MSVLYRKQKNRSKINRHTSRITLENWKGKEWTTNGVEGKGVSQLAWCPVLRGPNGSDCARILVGQESVCVLGGEGRGLPYALMPSTCQLSAVLQRRAL